MKTLTLEAPAKINLTLDILGRRTDGYHDMRMVMQAVSLGDTVTVAEAAGGFSLLTEGISLPAGKVTLEPFRRSVLPFVRQLLSPLAVSLLMAAILLPIQYATEGMNIFLTIIIKSIVSFTIFGGYIQATREYDLRRTIRRYRRSA